VRVLVCGGRDYNHAYRVHHALQQLPSDAVIVAGGARGADTLAEHSALALGMQVEVYYANWELFGKSAGVRRNQEMLDSGIDYVIAFEGGRGTADTVRRAEKRGIKVYFPDQGALAPSDFEERNDG
jgi:hypothetical protein